MKIDKKLRHGAPERFAIPTKLSILNPKQVPNYNKNPKHEIRNPKQIQMTEIPNSKQYDLAERTFKFAKDVRDYVKKLPRTISNIEYARQLIRASSSVGANYIEANESLSKKDFKFRIKISKKEAKESSYWLGLTEPLKEQIKDQTALIKEATELMRIFGAIIENVK